MENTITINMENLSEEERNQLISLAKKSNQPQRKRWRAKAGGIHYYIEASGDVSSDVDQHTLLDDAFFDIGNYFKTPDDADFEKEKRLVCQELYDYALEHNEEDIDWENFCQDKYCICFIHHNDSPNYQDILYIDEMQRVEYPNTVYFTSREIAQNAINTIGEYRVKKYLFGIKEDK